MRYLVFSAVIFLIITTACKHQQSYQEDAIRYFELNGTEKQYSDAIDQMYSLLKSQYGQIPKEVWQELQANKDIPLSEIKSLLVPVYEQSYSQEDIRSLISFYESDTGKQMLVDPKNLSAQQQSELSKFFSSDVGQKVQNQNNNIKQLISDVSETWSANLYQQTLDKLEAKGYQIR